MANIISNEQSCDKTYLQMSNSATSVFITIMSLAASKLAERENEKLISACIASCDQSVFGIGIVGFDLSDLPWSEKEAEFIKDKEFLLKAVKKAETKEDWDQLAYTPTPEYALENLQLFYKMVESFEFSSRREFDRSHFYLPENINDKCEIHGVYHHIGGCVICNEF